MESGDSADINQESLVRDNTIEIFECFIETQLERDRERNVIHPSTPSIPPEELPHTPDNRDAFSWQMGRRLAQIADTLVIDNESKTLIREIVQLVDIGNNDDRAFQEFSVIAKKVLVNGITWQNVATLLFFGYCIARDRLKNGVQHFLSQLLKWIVRVFKEFGIFNWILEQGGWTNFNNNDSNQEYNVTSWVFPSAVAGLVALIAIVAYRTYMR